MKDFRRPAIDMGIGLLYGGCIGGRHGDECYLRSDIGGLAPGMNPTRHNRKQVSSFDQV